MHYKKNTKPGVGGPNGLIARFYKPQPHGGKGQGGELSAPHKMHSPMKSVKGVGIKHVNPKAY